MNKDTIGKITAVTTLIINTDHDVVARLMEDYDLSGYTNAFGCSPSGSDIIIDLTYVEDDPDQFAHFSEITGLTKDVIEGASYVCFYA